MPRCEDFPCCGHEPGDCPSTDSKGRARYRCVECGKRLAANAASSICSPCLRRANDRAARGEEMFSDGDR